MSFVLDLVVLHLVATALLLVVLSAVMACQRTAGVVRQRSGERRALAVVDLREAGRPDRGRTIDLRLPASADRGAALQRTS